MVAHDMVGLVLGPKWMIVEGLMGWLSLSAGLLGLSSGAYTTFDALGKPHLGARMQWVRLVLFASALVPVALLTHVHRVPAIAMTRLAMTAAFMPTLLFAVGREVGVSPGDYLRALWRPFAAAGLMAGVLLGLNQLLPPGNFRLAIDVAIGALTFGSSLIGLWWLSGRPDTPEEDVAAFIRKIYERQVALHPDTLDDFANARTATKPICLYVPISKSRENEFLPRSVLGQIKARMVRARDRIRWKLLGSSAFDYHAWRSTYYTNKGDIAIREAIRGLLQARLGESHEYVELDWGSLDEAAVARINANAVLFVICGGGYVSADALSGKLSRTMDDVVLLPRITCPVITFGIGYNSLLECPRAERMQSIPQETTEKLSVLAAVSRLIGVRDCNLQEMLGEVSGKSIALIGDPALFLKPHAAGPLRPKANEGGPMRIGLNFALHGPISAAIFQSHFEAYASFLLRIQRVYRVEFFYFMHCDTEQIAVTMLRGRGVNVEVIDAPPRELIAAYAQMEIVICQMLHASILASNAGIPSMNIAYDRKNENFYALMGLPEMCVSHEDATPEKLLGAFVDLMHRRDAIAMQLARRKAQLLQALSAFIEDVARVREDHIMVHGGAREAAPQRVESVDGI
jgi:Polysaccharide pyruvyl transferase